MLLAVYMGIVLFCAILSICSIHYSFLIVTIQQESMLPTFQQGDRILVLRKCFKPWLDKGRVVLLVPPQEEHDETLCVLSSEFYIKRIIALSGESIALPAPFNKCAEREQTKPEQQETEVQASQQTWHIPAHHLFVCGDNREISRDSRKWGPVPLSTIRGVVLIRLWRASVPQSRSTQLFSKSSSRKKKLLPGDLAPDFQIQTVEEETITLLDYRGRLLLLLFVTAGPAMRQILPAHLSFAYDLEKSGVCTLLICNADKRRAQTLAQELAVRRPVVTVFHSQNALYEEYDISVRPAYCFIDASGRVLTSGPITQLAGREARSWQEDIKSKLLYQSERV